MITNCGRCHECGAKLRNVLDGEEWCPTCQSYRRYRSHGWTHGTGYDDRGCPHSQVWQTFQLIPESAIPRKERGAYVWALSNSIQGGVPLQTTADVFVQRVKAFHEGMGDQR